MNSNVTLVFDLDGVVVDTVELLFHIYVDILSEFGANGSRGEFNELNGCNLDEIVVFLVQKYSLSCKDAELKDIFIRKFSLMYAEVDLVDGVLATLEVLKENDIKIGLASSSKRDNINTVLHKFNIRHFFEFIVSGDDVARSKPFPDIYNLAKKHSMGWECYAVEDSANGILSAKRAGLITIFFNPAGQIEEERASYDVSHLSEIERIVFEDKPIIVSMSEHIEIVPHNNGDKVSEQEEKIANEILHKEKKLTPSLFNSNIVSYHSHNVSPNNDLVINCYISEYKYLLAQLKDRHLNLINPIGVSGVIIDKSNKILIGKRNNSVTEYKEHYEFVPSGGITAENMPGTLYTKQLETEVMEETGITSLTVERITPFCLIYDKKHAVFDIGLKIVLNDRINLDALVSKEYTQFILLDFDSLAHFMDQEHVVPTSKAICRVMLK